MADFSQRCEVALLHRLAHRSLDEMEAEFADHHDALSAHGAGAVAHRP
ncbi:MAG: hypothetical protein AB2598_04055 [Candidatus Thiodiazotropha sp.]